MFFVVEYLNMRVLRDQLGKSSSQAKHDEQRFLGP
jgi:hypothetical protein